MTSFIFIASIVNIIIVLSLAVEYQSVLVSLSKCALTLGYISNKWKMAQRFCGVLLRARAFPARAWCLSQRRINSLNL